MWLLQLDNNILLWVNSFSSPLNDKLAVFLTAFGSTRWIAALTLICVASLVYKKQRHSASLLAIGVGGAVLINLTLKAIFQRDRPELWERLVTENSYSFPSGHAMASSALALGVIVILWPTRWRYWALGLGGIYMVVIGLTRLYLGVHYPSDVIAGWSASAVWALIASAVIRCR